MTNKETEQLEIVIKEMMDKMISAKEELIELYQDLAIALVAMSSDQVIAMPAKTLNTCLLAYSFAMATVAREERIRRDSEMARIRDSN